MRPVRFMGTAKRDLSVFPEKVRLRAGHELFMVQVGRDPDDWKPMTTVGAGACELRIRDETGAFRVIYVVKFRSALYVLHAFQKKGQKTSREDLAIAERRYREAKAIDAKD